MVFDKNDIKILEKHIPVYAGIIKNRACSNLGIEDREVLLTMAKKMEINNICTTCPASLFYVLSMVYGQYLNDRNELDKIQATKNNKQKNECSRKQKQS